MSELIDDERAITRLVAEYGNRLDRGDHERWIDLFRPDGSLEVYGRSFTGPDGLGKMAAGAPGGLHMAGAPIIDIDDDRATVQQSFFFVDQVTRESRIGFYDDDVVRTDGRWQFQTRRCTFLTPEGASDRP